MTEREKVFDALRNCVTEPKCKDCPWEDCEKIGCKRTTVPVTLLLDTLNLLKEQQKQRFFVDSDGKITPLPIQPQWISVKDRLPEQSGYVLTCYGDYHTINVFSYSKKHRAFNAHDCLPTAENNVDVTHWMPLPKPPERVKKNG